MFWIFGGKHSILRHRNCMKKRVSENAGKRAMGSLGPLGDAWNRRVA